MTDTGKSYERSTRQLLDLQIEIYSVVSSSLSWHSLRPRCHVTVGTDLGSSLDESVLASGSRGTKSRLQCTSTVVPMC